MPIITLLTDWGSRDYHLSALKGLILASNPLATIVDLTHSISRFNILEASYIVKNVIGRFPDGTVHFIGVTNIGVQNKQLLVMKYANQYFIGYNDGLLSLINKNIESSEVIEFVVDENSKPTYDLETIAYLSTELLEHTDLSKLGNQIKDLVIKKESSAIIDESLIRMTVIYIDDFGNVITNLNKNDFYRIKGNREFEVLVRKTSISTISMISKDYQEIEHGALGALFNDAGYMEIFINNASASQLLGTKINDSLRIEFK